MPHYASQTYLTHIELGFAGISFGAGTTGIHGATGPDIMHLMDEGLIQKVIAWIIDMILMQDGGKAKLAKLDHRYRNIVFATRRKCICLQVSNFQHASQ